VVGGNLGQLQSVVKNKFVSELSASFSARVLEAIPCYCDVLGSGGRKIFSLETPDHPLVKVLASVAETLDGL